MGSSALFLDSLCNKTFADANATGIYTFTPNVDVGPNNPVSAAITLYKNDTFVQNALWYNTGKQNYNDADALGYDVCLIGLPSPTNLTIYRAWHNSDDGSCTGALGSSCVSALGSAAASHANTIISTPGTNADNTSALPLVCQSVGRYIQLNIPDECSSYFDATTADGPGVYSSPLTNFGTNSSILYENPQCVIGESSPGAGPYTHTDNVYWPFGELDFGDGNNTYMANANHLWTFIMLFTPLVGEEYDRQDSSASTQAHTICLRDANFTAGSYQPPGPPNPNPSSLSGGDIAGIVIGSIAGAALIFAALFFLWRRRRTQRRRRLNDDEKPVVPELGSDGATIEADSAAVEELPTEKYGPAELQPKMADNELPVEDDSRHELEGENAVPMGELPANEPMPVEKKAE